MTKTKSLGGYNFKLNAGTAYIAKVDIHGQDSKTSVRIYTVKKIWEPSPTMYNPPRRMLVSEVPNLHIRKAVELADKFNLSSGRVW